MELRIETLLMFLALAGTAAYTAYMVEKRREEIRKTIEVIELKDAEFWQGLTALRNLIPARA